MLNLKNLWAAEYSQKQRALNIDTLARILQTNIKQVQNQDGSDYVIFGIFETIEEADAVCEAMKVRQELLYSC
jgi:hypothetical protein